MILTANDVITRARDVAQDAGAVYWPAAEALRWLNDGRAEMYEKRPDVYERTETLSLVAGHEQTLPMNSTRLFAVLANVSHSRRRFITPIAEEALARHRPNWRSEALSDEILHFMYDPVDQEAFDVYPPAKLGVQVRISYARLPLAIQQSQINVGLLDESTLASSLVDYLLYRFFQKESDTNPGFSNRAAGHKAAFDGALALGAAVKSATSPSNATEPRAE